MKTLNEHLESLSKHPRRKLHHLTETLHQEHIISKKTLFYIKEYGTKTNTVKTIFRESFRILILASLISSLGGFTLEKIKTLLITIVPLIILIPALNDMIGDYGVIVSAKVSTLLHQGKFHEKWWKTEEIRLLLWQILIIAFITTLICVGFALIASWLSSYQASFLIIGKILLIALLDVMIMTSLLFLVSIKAGLYFYQQGEDPNNFLIPIATSLADFGNMILLWLLVTILF